MAPRGAAQSGAPELPASWFLAPPYGRRNLLGDHMDRPAPAMVGFADQLTDEEIWAIIQYTRTFRRHRHFERARPDGGMVECGTPEAPTTWTKTRMRPPCRKHLRLLKRSDCALPLHPPCLLCRPLHLTFQLTAP